MLPPNSQQKKNKHDDGNRPEVGRLVPGPPPHLVSFKVGWSHVDGDFKVSFLPTVEVPGGKRKADNQGGPTLKEHKAQNSDHASDAQSFNDVPEPVEIVLNVLPVEIHASVNAHKWRMFPSMRF